MKECNIFFSIGVWDEDHEYIMSNKKDIDTFVILEHEGRIHMSAEKVCYDIVLSGMTDKSIKTQDEIDGNEYKLPPTYKYYSWPLCQIHSTINEYKYIENTNESILFNEPKKYQNLYLNHTRRPHPHRVELLNQLYNHNLIDYGINTFLNTDKESDCNGVDFHTYPWYSHINNYDNSSDGWITPNYINHDAAIEIVTETETDFVRFTEKTWKPILNRHPFLILGGRGIHKYLHSLGFHLYEEIFDYSFDEKNDEQQRIMGIVNNLKKLKKIKPYKIVRHVKNKIIDNYEKLLEYTNNDITLPYEFILKLNEYDKILLYSRLGNIEVQDTIIKSIKKINQNIEFEIISGK